LTPLQHCEEPQNAAPLLQWQRELSEILDLQRVRRGAIVTEYIQELKDVIRRRHGREATHVESVPIKEEFQGRTLWDGVVEGFDLTDHRDAGRVYAWAYDADDPSNRRRSVTVLHIYPIKSARDAVRLQSHGKMGRRRTSRG
jgi:hypothetical protein